MAGSLLRVLAPPIMVLVLSLATAPALAACGNHAEGTVTVPTVGGGPPVYSHPTVQTNAVHVGTVNPGSPYELFAVGGSSSVTIGGTRAIVPDFNVAWCQNNNGMCSLVANHNQAGDQEGLVPSAAEYAVVYMRYGPDLVSDDSLRGASFELRTAC